MFHCNVLRCLCIVSRSLLHNPIQHLYTHSLLLLRFGTAHKTAHVNQEWRREMQNSYPWISDLHRQKSRIRASSVWKSLNYKQQRSKQNYLATQPGTPDLFSCDSKQAILIRHLSWFKETLAPHIKNVWGPNFIDDRQTAPRSHASFRIISLSSPFLKGFLLNK